MYMDTPLIQVGTVFYGNQTTCNYYPISGLYIGQNNGNYILITMVDGVVTQVFSVCPNNFIEDDYIDDTYFE